MRRALLLLLPLALAACSGTRDDADSSGLTRDQDRQLDAAAAATDSNATVSAGGNTQ